MSDSLDPEHLTPRSSLNRVCIVGLPGIDLEPDVKGKMAGELLSAGRIADDVREHAAALGIGGGQPLSGGEALAALNRSVRSADQVVRDAASEMACYFGRRLGYLLLTLKRGDEINRQARPDWDDSYWAHWARIRAVWLGGGIASGPFGARLCDAAAEALLENGVADLALRVADYPASLPLIGAARSVPGQTGTALVFDFGSSLVKRACAVYDQGALSMLRLLPPLPAPQLSQPLESVTPREVEGLAHQMVHVMAQTWQSAQSLGQTLNRSLVASLATYICDGQPFPRQWGQLGTYATLRALPEVTACWLSRRLGEQVGLPLGVELLHDGSAAARTYAGQQHTAVIMLGTAIGVGFAPSEEGLRPVGRDFTVVAER